MNKYTNKNQTLRERKIASKQWFLGKTFRLILSFFLVVVSVLFLAKISSVSTKGFEISDLEEKKIALEQDTRQLEVEIAKYRSMDSIQSRLAQIGMVEAENMHFILPAGTEVARR